MYNMKKFLIITSFLFFFQAGFIIIAMYLGLRKTYVTPNPFYDIYFRDKFVILILTVLYALMIWFLFKAKNKQKQFLFFALSIALTLPIGQSVWISDYECSEFWGFIEIKKGATYRKKNIELATINSRENERDHYFTQHQTEKYPCLNYYNNEDWIVFQYGLKDSCIMIYNGYPEFFKLKEQPLK